MRKSRAPSVATGQPKDRTCIRIGCNRRRYFRTDAGCFRPYCSLRCRYWQRSYNAFTMGGAVLGRDADTDRALFAGLLALGLHDGEAPLSVLGELYDAYGRP